MGENNGPKTEDRFTEYWDVFDQSGSVTKVVVMTVSETVEGEREASTDDIRRRETFVKVIPAADNEGRKRLFVFPRTQPLTEEKIRRMANEWSGSELRLGVVVDGEITPKAKEAATQLDVALRQCTCESRRVSEGFLDFLR